MREYLIKCGVQHAPELSRIERCYRAQPRSLVRWERHLESKDHHAYAVLRDGRILGYVLVEIINPTAILREIVIEPSERRRGLGKRLITKVTTEFRASNLETLDSFVRERDLGVQLFLKACGLRCNGIAPYDEHEDIYRFQLRQCAGVTAAL